jgi:hypothetical protein
MPYRDLEPLSKQVTIVVGLTVVGFMTFGLALSFYRNILFEQHLAEIGDKNQELSDDIKKGEEDLAYYRSTQYRDKYAKETLGRLNPGEKMLILMDDQAPGEPVAADAQSSQATTNGLSTEQEAAYEENLRQIPVISHWKLFLFERDKLEELKKNSYLPSQSHL